MKAGYKLSGGLFLLAGLSLLMSFALKTNPGREKAAKPKRILLTENKAEKRVDISIDGQPFTSYIYPDNLKKPVLYPLRTAQGTLITRGWPLQPRPGERVDHPHHVGLWFNYGDVNGYDFWNNSTTIDPGNRSPFGTIVHQEVNKLVSGNKKGELEVTSNWQKPDGTVLLQENTHYIFSGAGNTRIIDRITTLTAQQEDVLFKDNKEGLVALRVSRELEHPSTQPEIFTDASGHPTLLPQMNTEGITGLYRSSEGKEGHAVWGTRAKWVNLMGKIGSEPIALVLMDHPDNIGYPAYWHARGYGLFGANNLGYYAMSNGKEVLNYKLQAGKSVTFRHRVLIHTGSTLPDNQVNKAYNQFSE